MIFIGKKYYILSYFKFISFFGEFDWLIVDHPVSLALCEKKFNSNYIAIASLFSCKLNADNEAIPESLKIFH